MLFRSLSVLILMSFFISVVRAGSTEMFEKRFELVKKDGKITLIRDRSLSFKFSIKPYIQFIKSKLKEEQALMNSKADYEYEVARLFEAEEMEKGSYSSQNVRYVVESMRELKKINVDEVFKNKQFQNVISQFEGKIGEAMLQLDPSILANLDNPKFFYNKHLTYEAVKFGLNIAKKLLSSIPMLNTASYVIVRVEKLIRERRTFHQNMLMHYFEKFPEDQLGMTHEEVNRAWSSIYESRIPWFAFWESQAAVANWDKYGTSKFFANIRMANTRLRAQSGNYSSLGKRLNYAFQEATYNDQDVLLNLFDNQDMFRNVPAIAWYVHSPNKVLRQRTVLQLAQLGLSFLSVPAFVKTIAENYMKSYYETQKLTEGALYGYFESLDNVDGMEQVKAQYMNPFDSLEIK